MCMGVRLGSGRGYLGEVTGAGGYGGRGNERQVRLRVGTGLAVPSRSSARPAAKLNRRGRTCKTRTAMKEEIIHTNT